MKDNNAKAPMKRSGDNINPVLGSVIKISAIVVIAALIVLITLVTIQLVKNNKKIKPIFDEDIRIELNLKEFEEITDPATNIDDVSNKKIRDILEILEEEDLPIHFYFYYSNLRKYNVKEKKDEIDLLNSIDKNALIFIVDLYEEETAENEAGRMIDYIRVHDQLMGDPVQIGTILDAPLHLNLSDKEAKKTHNKKYLTFILEFDFLGKATSKKSFKPINNTNISASDSVLSVLSSYVN